MQKIAANIVLMYKGQVLLGLRAEGKSGGGKWAFPGGKVDEWETIIEGLIREVSEELGICILAHELKQVDIRRSEDGYIANFFQCEIGKEKLDAIKVKLDETAKVQLFDVGSNPGIAFACHQRVFDKL